LNVLTKIRR